MKKLFISICLLLSFTSLAQNIESWQVNSKLAQMGAVVALKQLPNGDLCYMDVRGNDKFTPDFIKPSGGSDPLSISDIPVCNSEEQKDIQAQAKNSYLTNGHAQKAIWHGAIIGAGAGCFMGFFYGIGTTTASNSNVRVGLSGTMVGAGTVGAVEAHAIIQELIALESKGASGAVTFAAWKRVFKSMLTGAGPGLAGAIVCKEGITYLLSDTPKTNM